MKSRSLSFAFASLAAALFSGAAMADHNSVNGAGWANMPNDIHNIQIEDDLSASEFRSIVQHGGARDTVNRYLDTDAVTSASAVVQRGAGSANGGSRR